MMDRLVVRYTSKTFWGGLFVGMLLFGVFTAVAIWITLQFPVALNAPAVRYSAVIFPTSVAYCPGAEVSFSAYIEVQEQSIISTYYTTIDAKTGANLAATQGRSGPRLYPRGITGRAIIPFQVPYNLKPGSYKHVRASIALNKDTEPAFVEIPFTVRACS